MRNELEETASAVTPKRNSEDRLRRLLDATPEQQALVDHILEGRVNPKAAGQLNMEELLTKKELAVRTKTTVRTIENWQRRGVLPYVKVGKIVLFIWGDVLDALKTNFRVCRKTK